MRNSNTCTFSQIIIIDPTQAGRKRGTSRRPATETDKDGVFLPNELVPLPDV